MPIGPGKYDEQCTRVRLETGAAACIVMVFGGDKGSGFSCQIEAGGPPVDLPAVLRSLADQIEGGLAELN